MLTLFRRMPFPLNLPWSQSFYLCCEDVRHSFTESILALTVRHRRYETTCKSFISSSRVSRNITKTSMSC